jgi:serine/threonine-protein kinase SRPK3
MESSGNNRSVAMTYRYIESVESLEEYRRGGFHPITIGDRLRRRYHIVHKLGFGSYSTVWLARDERADRYVAIKIAAAEETGESQESTITCLLRDKVHPWKDFILPTLDEFLLTGPNGKHQCIVTVPARMNVAEAQDASVWRLFQLPVARAIAAQLILAVSFLHSQGIVHAGKYPGIDP